MRECGDCVACCVFLKPGDPGSLTLMACPHVNIDGFRFSGKNDCGNCKIYEERPEMCRDFQCDYILGKEDKRPNISRDHWLITLDGPIPKFLGMMKGKE